MADLNTKIKLLPGVGPKFGAKLEKLGIETFQDLLLYYPRTYRDFTKITKIGNIGRHSRFSRESTIVDPRLRGDDRGGRGDNVSEKITIRGNILGISNKKTSRRRFTVTEAVVEDGTGSIKVVWFNQPFLLKMLPAGREVILNGKISFNFYTKEVVMESPERTPYPQIVPVYGETAGLTTYFIARLFSKIRSFISEIEEFLPRELLCHSRFSRESTIVDPRLHGDDNEGCKDAGLLSIHDALLNIHQPKDSEMLEKARRRIAFDELFMISLRANLSKEEIKKENAPVISKYDKKIAYATFLSYLPFELTGDQKKATEQILEDMAKSVPMNRLLNGDVGSGKTVVAAIAAYVAIKAGYRVAIMCPTSILASQHFETFCKLFKEQDISIGIYTRERKESSQISKSKLQISNKNQNPKSKILDSDVVIGTQALIQEGVAVENIGLVIVDEQHRFGVTQRSSLQKMGVTDAKKPHFLSMTATPIPRTLHLALFGDLDISVIKEKPANRKEIKTRFVETRNREKAYEFVRAHIKVGRQAFVICPLIEEIDGSSLVIPAEAGIQKNYNIDSGSQATGRNDSLSLFDQDRKSVKAEYEKLQKVFPEFVIGMLHGKLKSKEKDAVMAEFVSNRLNILVSTSVVEVGVDVPNATVMVIEDAERFGLAQIHQFRGRVGRAEHQSFCFLFSSTRSSKALERLRSLEATSDGFKLAEIDLEQRGPGAVFGTEQSGMLDLKMANFSDRVLIEEASSAAKSIIETDPELKNHPLLKGKIADYLQNKHLE